MSKLFIHPCSSSVSSSSPASGSASPRTHVARLPVAAVSSSSPPVTAARSSEPYSPLAVIALPPPSPPSGDRGNKKAWNMPNVAAMEVSIVMGADSWPTLTDSVSKASAKSVAKALSTASSSKGGNGSSSSSLSERPEGNGNQGLHRNTQSMLQVQVGSNHRRGNQGAGSGRPGGSDSNWRHGGRRNGDDRRSYWNGPPSFIRNPPVWMSFPQPPTQPPLASPVQPAFFLVSPHGYHPSMRPMAFPDMDLFPPYHSHGPPPPPLETFKQMPLRFPQPRPKLKEQIEYYFSDENLCKDIFLRKHMDDQGWVPVSLIATFNRVRSLTTNIQYILNVLQDSKVVEVQGAKIRRRDKWMNWLLPSAQTHNELPGNRPESANQSSSNQTPTQESKLQTICPPTQ